MTGEQTAYLVWPEVELPAVPIVCTPGEWTVEDEWALVFHEGSPDWRLIDLPDAQFWMQELLSVDLESATELAAFANSHGMLWRFPPKDSAAERRRSIDDLVLDFRVFRNVARVLLVVAGDSEPFESVDLEVDGTGLSAQMKRKAPDPGRMRWAIHEINRHLTAMAPRLAYNDQGLLGKSLATNLVQNRRVLLADALAAQMFNFAVTRPHVSHCRLPSCEKPFIYQRGRAKYAQHRADAVYCRAEHATDAARMRYREKERMRKAKGGETQ